MNETNEYNNIKPYKASGNLNTAIANPSVNINDTMNVNIQNLATNQPNLINNQNNINYNEAQINNTNIQTIPNNTSIQTNDNQTFISNTNNIPNATVQNYTAVTNNNMNNTLNESNIVSTDKTYVSTTDNNHKKKNKTFNLGPEFKIGLLIVVILLAFVFLLPMLSDLIFGNQ